MTPFTRHGTVFVIVLALLGVGLGLVNEVFTGDSGPASVSAGGADDTSTITDETEPTDDTDVPTTDTGVVDTSSTSTTWAGSSSQARASASVPRLPASASSPLRDTLAAKKSRILGSSSTISTSHMGPPAASVGRAGRARLPPCIP